MTSEPLKHIALCFLTEHHPMSLYRPGVLIKMTSWSRWRGLLRREEKPETEVFSAMPSYLTIRFRIEMYLILILQFSAQYSAIPSTSTAASFHYWCSFKFTRWGACSNPGCGKQVALNCINCQTSTGQLYLLRQGWVLWLGSLQRYIISRLRSWETICIG